MTARHTPEPVTPVLLHVEERIARITLNDPEHRNAITPAMSSALSDAVHAVEQDPDVHAVVVTGAGSAFCAGAERSTLRTADETVLRQLYKGFLAVADCRLPTIAAVNGPAVGAGLNLALACDVRVAGPRARFDARFLELGVHPGGGATWMLQRAIGPEAARAALLFGTAFDATEAVRLRLALMIAQDPLQTALSLAAAPAAAARELVVVTKRTMQQTISPGTTSGASHELSVEIETGPQVWSLQRIASAQQAL
ncbi:enoyl-CoA hydratase [Mycobacterium sp. NPDC003449]